MNIVLYQPEIPQNTGNIARTAAVSASTLHLIKPMGFSLSEKALRRAGLDYWNLLDVHVYENFEDFKKTYPNQQLYLLTTHAQKSYADYHYRPDDFFMFGKETAGVPEYIHKDPLVTSIRIPMLDLEQARSLNLSNAVSIILYEALKQNSFPNLR